MKKIRLLVLLLLLLLTACQSNTTDAIYIDSSSDLTSSSEILKLNVQENQSYYDEEMQTEISNQLKNLQANRKDFKDGLFIMNPFGTFSQSLYSYIPNEDQKIKEIEYTIQSEYSKTFSKKPINYSKQDEAFEFTIIGLVPGEQNKLTVDLINHDDESMYQYEFVLNMPDVQAEDYGHSMEIIEEGNPSELSDGLFATMGSSAEQAKYIYFFDNDGTIRSELITDGERVEDYHWIDDQHILIKVDKYKLAIINGLGQVIKTYEVKGFPMHHDFVLSRDKQLAFLLASEEDTETIEDVIVQLDLKTGEFKKIIDLREVLSSYYQPVMADYKQRAENAKKELMDAGEEINGEKIGQDQYPTDYFDENGKLNKLDWIHINSIDLLNEDELILSSRESSSIIKLSNIFNDVQIDYIIAMPEVWQGTGYEHKLLTPLSEFKPTGGQHTVFFQDNEIEDLSYDLSIYDNNYWRMNTRPDFDSGVSEKINREGQSENLMPSYFKIYRINEEEGNYDLVQSIELPYSPIVSSSQIYKGNYIANSGTANILAEYNPNGEIIRQYKYSIPSWSYRIKKMDFTGFFYH